MQAYAPCIGIAYFDILRPENNILMSKCIAHFAKPGENYSAWYGCPFMYFRSNYCIVFSWFVHYLGAGIT
jgi:hypothetical protein